MMDMKGRLWILLLLVWICHMTISGATEDHSRFVGAEGADEELPSILELPSHQGLQEARRSSDLEAEARAGVGTRIIGRDGLCVEVEGIRDNSPVIIATCRRSDWLNQLWTWRSDGRIVSLGKCLTASGNKAGSSVVIRECDALDFASPSQWHMDELGNLVHNYSRLFLTAVSPSRLTVEARAQSSFQAWTRTNQTTMAEVAIIGQNNQCIYYNGRRGVYTQDCSSGGQVAMRQRWRLYPDSTVRPVNWLAGCLSLQSLEHPTSRYNYIQAWNCNSYPEYHRWIFTNRGAIQNLKSGLVVDADREHAGYLQAEPFVAGARNQIWRTRSMN